MDRKSNGFTLVELIVVIAVLGIIIAIAVPKLFGFKGLAVERVCETNRNTVTTQYEVYLQTKVLDKGHFNQFLYENFDEVCPDDGVITYEYGKVKCSIHKNVSESDEEELPDGEVPWL